MTSPSQISLFESFDLIGRTTILGASYGITFTLYCLCARLLCLQPDQQRRAWFTLGYISLLLFCTTGSLVLNTGMMQLAFIKYRDFPGGPLGYQATFSGTTVSYGVTASVFDFIVVVSVLAIQIWRLRMVWNGTRYAMIVVILPLLLLFAYIALFVLTAMVFTVVPPEQLGISIKTAFAVGVTCYVVPTGLTLFVTGFIAGRILLVRKRQNRILGTSNISNPYTTVVAMLVESYALESAWSLATAIASNFDDPSSAVLATNDSTIKVIAYFLIVYRVATKRGWTQQTERELTSLQWNHGGQTTTGPASDIRSQTPATTAEVAAGPISVSRPKPTV